MGAVTTERKRIDCSTSCPSPRWSRWSSSSSRAGRAILILVELHKALFGRAAHGRTPMA